MLEPLDVVLQLSIFRYELAHSRLAACISSVQSEHFVDELILTPDISSAHPSNLPLAQHEDRFITLNRFDIPQCQ